MDSGPFFHFFDIDDSLDGIEGSDATDLLFAVIQIFSAANLGLLLVEGVALDAELALKGYSLHEAKPGKRGALVQQIFVV